MPPTTFVPALPPNAPFTPAQISWLNGYLAGLYGGANVPAGLVPGAGDPASGSGPTPSTPVTVVFGSQSGNSEALADGFGEKLTAAGFAPTVVSMEDQGGDLTKIENLIVVTSTWGDGDPPDNAVAWWEKLGADDAPKLDKLRFAVLALGDSNYLSFCGFGKKVDGRLEALGATRLTPRSDCDTDYEEAAEQWFSAAVSALQALVPAGGESPAGAPAPDQAPAAPAPASYSKKNPFPAPLLRNLKLNGEGSERDTRHFELSLEGSGLEYEAGDALGVKPVNCPDYTDDLIAAARLDPSAEIEFNGGRRTLRDVLLHDCAITVPGPSVAGKIAAAAGSGALTELAADRAALAGFLWGREVIDLLNEFAPEKSWAPDEFAGLFAKLQPRLYSISSSPKAHPGSVHLTIARVGYESHGRPRKGVCSTYLSDRVADGAPVRVFVHKNKAFRPPADGSTPLVMIGPGTGIAPFRAFLEERKASGATGRNWLLFGNPHESTDYLYREEIEGFLADGTLTRLDLAWSRDQERKIYVQDKIAAAGAELWSWLQDGAAIAVCGDAKRMAKDVDAAIHRVAGEHGGLDADAAKAFVADLRSAGRYQRDVY